MAKVVEGYKAGVKYGRPLFKKVIEAAQELRKLGGTQAERMARAASQDFDLSRPVYHSTATDFDAFDPDRAIGTQFWSTTDKAAAEAGEVGAQGQGVIKEMYHRIKNPAGWAEYDKYGIDELKRMGYDGVALPEGEHVTYIAFEPNQYRDVNADFNPEYRDSPNLLASVAGAMPYAGATAALLAGATGSQEAEAGPLQSLGRAAPYLTSAALGGAAALQSGDAEAGAGKAMVYALNSTEPEKLAKVIEQMKELGSPTVRAVWEGDHWKAIEGSHRIAAAEKLGLPVKIQEVSPEDVITGHDLYDLADPTTVEDMLVNGSDWSSAAYNVELGNATPALLAATAVGTGAGMYAASDAEAGTLDALGRAAPYLATGALGAAMMTPQDAQAEPISIMPPTYNDTMQRTQAAINKIDQFKAKRAGKRGAMDIMKLELQTLLKGASLIANDVLLPELDKAEGPLRMALGFGGVFDALARGKPVENSWNEFSRVMRQPADQSADDAGGVVTDTLSPYVPHPVAAGAGALTKAAILMNPAGL